MKTEELAKIMLDEAPDVWPVGVRAFALPREGMPDTTRARIRNLIREAVIEAETNAEAPAEDADQSTSISTKTTPAWRWLAAAVLPVALGLGGVYYWYTTQTGGPAGDYGMTVSHVSGEVARLKAGERTPVAAEERIMEGERLVLGPDGVLSMKNEAALFWLGGEGDFEVRRMRKAPDPDIEVFVHFGNISIRSDYTADKSIVWSTGSLDARATGTQARLTVDDEYQTLEVLEGSFDVRVEGADSPRKVAAGQVFTYQVGESADAIPPNRELLDVEKEDLQLLLDKMEAVQKGQPIKEERTRFDTEEEIKQHFGSLQEVTLGDGRVYRGYVKVNGDQVSIYTTFSVIEVNRALVQSITDLK